MCFHADTSEEAHKKASLESELYETDNNVVAHPEQSGYEQDGKPLIDGYELWSELFQSTETLEQFYSRRYGQYEYKPDAPDA